MTVAVTDSVCSLLPSGVALAVAVFMMTESLKLESTLIVYVAVQLSLGASSWAQVTGDIGFPFLSTVTSGWLFWP